MKFAYFWLTPKTPTPQNTIHGLLSYSIKVSFSIVSFSFMLSPLHHPPLLLHWTHFTPFFFDKNEKLFVLEFQKKEMQLKCVLLAFKLKFDAVFI